MRNVLSCSHFTDGKPRLPAGQEVAPSPARQRQRKEPHLELLVFRAHVLNALLPTTLPVSSLGPVLLAGPGCFPQVFCYHWCSPHLSQVSSSCSHSQKEILSPCSRDTWFSTSSGYNWYMFGILLNGFTIKMHYETIIIKTGNNPNLFSAGKWINKLWCMHTMKYYPTIRRDELLIVTTTWITSDALCWVGEARLKRLQTVRFHLCNSLEKAKLLRQKTERWGRHSLQKDIVESMEYYSTWKRKEVLTFATTRMNLEDIC